MKKLLIGALLIAGCDNPPAPAPVVAPPPPPADSSPAPKKPEPERIVVQHILIAFKGAMRSSQARSKAEAETLAKELLDRARKGEAFEELMKRYSDDPGGGEYGMANSSVAPAGPPKEFARGQMVPAFGNVGFQLDVNQIGLAPHHDTESPFGWHVIKRVK